jgi:acetyl esterase/lipase
MMLRDQGKPLPGKQVLLYPATYWDHSPDSVFDSVKTYGEEYGLTWQRIEDYMTLYVPDAELRQTPQVSPIMAPDLSRLPETLVVTAEYDPLRDEGEAYGKLLQEAGVKAEIVRIPDAIHGFITFPKISSSLTAAYGAINAFLEETPPGENSHTSMIVKEG